MNIKRLTQFDRHNLRNRLRRIRGKIIGIHARLSVTKQDDAVRNMLAWQNQLMDRRNEIESLLR